MFSLSLPIAASVVLVYGMSQSRMSPAFVGNVLWLLTLLAFGACVLPLIAAVCSFRAEKRSANASPWDMTLDPDSAGITPQERSSVPTATFDEAAEDLGFDRPAIGIASAEGWHARYDWTDGKQRRAVALLAQPFAGVDGRGPCDAHGGCQWKSCPAHPLSHPEDVGGGPTRTS